MDRTELYTQKLARMISAETISKYEPQDMQKFYDFHSLLKELFPAITAACSWEYYGASLLLRWPGKGPEAASANGSSKADSSADSNGAGPAEAGNKGRLPRMFMNHFDVVDVQEDWTHAPFGAEIADGKLYGRGTLDTKGGLFAMLQAADELAAEGFVPETDIYFESSCCEETTFEGAQNFGEMLAERGMRFEYIIDEGGMIMYEPISGAKGTFAMIGMGERGCSDLLFTARGAGGHASTPEKDTPLVRLGKFMKEADSYSLFDKKIAPVIQEMFRRLAPSVKGPLGFVFAHPVFFGPLLRCVMPRVSSTAGALLSSTIAFTMATGSEGRNVIPTRATVIGNMRVSHHQGYKSSLETVKKLADKYGIETTVLEEAIESPLADYRSESFGLVEKAVTASYPGVVSVPYIMTGCSDARFMAKLTDSCFHFVPFLIDEKQMESIHSIDENVDISTLAPAVDFYKYLMEK